MKIEVLEIAIPAGSTVGYGVGRPVGDDTKRVLFAGDQRAMEQVALQAIAAELDDELVEIEIPDWSILEIREL